MKRKNLLQRVGGFFLTVLLAFGVVMVSGPVAQAQRRHRRVIVVRPFRPFNRPYWGWGYPYGNRYWYNNQYVFNSDNAAEHQGYHDGLKTGTNDARRRQSYDPERSHYFQEAGFGNFSQAYRDGFSRGYRDGYRS